VSFNDYWQAEQKRRRLREVMVAVRDRVEGSSEQLQSALRAAIVLVPVREMPPNHDIGDTVRGANVPLQVMLARDEQERQHLVVFTSEKELATTYPGSPPFIGLPFEVLAHLATQAPIVDVVIDKDGGAALTFPPTLLKAWARPAPQNAEKGEGGKSPQLVAGQAQLTAPPRPLTWQELAALREVLMAQEGLVQAYLFGVLHGNPPPLLTVGLGFTTPPTPDRMQALARDVGKVLGASGVLALDSRLPVLLARQPGAIRFDLEPSPPLLPAQAGEGGDSEAAPPPNLPLPE
jgi:hypothetical protein